MYQRHGATSLNKGGSEERLRGWLSVPLSDIGVQQAHEAGQRLRDMLPPSTFSTSDLYRAQQTAGIVGQYIGMQATPDPALRDWHTGYMAGQKVTDVMDDLKYYIAHPDEAPKDGEPLNSYLDRFVPAMRQRVAAPGVHLVVGHARGATILEGIADPVGGVGQDINPKFLFARPNVQPGGTLMINRDWQTQMDNPSIKAA